MPFLSLPKMAMRVSSERIAQLQLDARAPRVLRNARGREVLLQLDAANHYSFTFTLLYETRKLHPPFRLSVHNNTAVADPDAMSSVQVTRILIRSSHISICLKDCTNCHVINGCLILRFDSQLRVSNDTLKQEYQPRAFVCIGLSSRVAYARFKN